MFVGYSTDVTKSVSEEMILLQTDRLLFRTHEAGDEAAFVEMHTDFEVRRYVGGRAWSRDEAVKRFRTQYLGKPSGSYGFWATVLKAQHAYIGMCGLNDTPPGPRLAYYIARRYWGQGLASEAASAFVDYGLRRLQLSRILADADKGNRASERILEKLGFRVFQDETLDSGRVIRHYERYA